MIRSLILAAALLGLAAPATAQAPVPNAMRCTVPGGGPTMNFGYDRAAGVALIVDAGKVDRQAVLFDANGFRSVGSTTDGQDAYFMAFDEKKSELSFSHFKPTAEEHAELQRDNNTVARQTILVPKYAGHAFDQVHVLTCTRPGA